MSRPTLLACLTLALFPLAPGLQTGTQKSKALLVAVTTGSGEAGGSDLVTLDPSDGRIETIGRIVPAQGHRLLQAQDLEWSADGQTLIVTQLAFDERNEGHTWIEWVDPASLKVLRKSDVIAGVLDALAWDGRKRLLATHATSRPQELLALDPETGARTVLGAFDRRLWVRSLVWDANREELWGLHQRTPELDQDALVRLAPKDGALQQIVKLEMPELATAFALDSHGAIIVTGNKGGTFQVDPKTGQAVRAKMELGCVVNGLVPGR